MRQGSHLNVEYTPNKTCSMTPDANSEHLNPFSAVELRLIYSKSKEYRFKVSKVPFHSYLFALILFSLTATSIDFC